MQKQRFQPCFTCEYKFSCNVAKSRLQGLDAASPILADIGCFDYEIYKKQTEDRQLNLGF